MTRYTVVGKTVKELKEMLDNFPDNTVVLSYDPEVGTALEITGLLYNPAVNTLEIQTDEP